MIAMAMCHGKDLIKGTHVADVLGYSYAACQASLLLVTV